LVLHSRAPATSRVTNDEIDAKAKALCADDSLEPNQHVTHAYGDDFTAQEMEVPVDVLTRTQRQLVV
jgi:hypothetical protein